MEKRFGLLERGLVEVRASWTVRHLATLLLAAAHIQKAPKILGIVLLAVDAVDLRELMHAGRLESCLLSRAQTAPVITVEVNIGEPGSANLKGIGSGAERLPGG